MTPTSFTFYSFYDIWMRSWLPGVIIPTIHLKAKVIVFLKIGYLVQKKIFLTLYHIFTLYWLQCIALLKRKWSFIRKKTWKPFPQGCFVTSLSVWNWPYGSLALEKDENVKSWQQRPQTTDNFWSEKPTWAFGLCEFKMKPTICHAYTISAYMRQKVTDRLTDTRGQYMISSPSFGTEVYL